MSKEIKVPYELREQKQWILWRLLKKPGQDKPAKIPVNPLNLSPASSTDPNTWTDFDTAIQAMEENPGHFLGYVFAGNGYCGLDFDNCIDIATGEISGEVADYLTAHQGKYYVEVSQSGKGLKVIGKTTENLTLKTPEIEIYTSKRFFALTLITFDTPVEQLQSIAILPHWRKQSVQQTARVENNRAIKQGEIDNELYRYACSLRRKGMGDDEVKVLLQLRVDRDVEGSVSPGHVDDLIRSSAKFAEKKVEKFVEPELGEEFDKESRKRELIATAPPIWKEFVRESCNNSVAAQPWLSLSAAICATSTLIGSKIVSHTRLPLNLYHLHVANPGAGKGGPIKAVKELFSLLKLSNKTALEDATSDAAIYQYLEATGTGALFLADEFGHTLRKVAAQAKNGGSAGGIATALLKLYSAATDSQFAPMSYANRPVQMTLAYPFLSVMASATPSSIESALSSSFASDGLLSRLNFWYGESVEEDPRKEIRSFQLLGFSEWGDEVTRTISAEPGAAYPLRTVEAFFHFWEQLNAQIKQVAINQEADLIGACLVRLKTTYMKYVCLYTLAEHCHNAAYSQAGCEWSYKLCIALLSDFIEKVGVEIGGNEKTRLMSRIEAFVDKHKGVSRSDITKGFQGLSKGAVNEALTTLIETGRIILMVVPTKTRTKEMYYSSKSNLS